MSRLEIAGIYYEVDDDDPSDELGPNINRLHVIGRTRTHPAVYYYRCYDLNTGEWTPWRPDRPGDQRRPGRPGDLQPPAAPVLAGDQREAAEGAQAAGGAGLDHADHHAGPVEPAGDPARVEPADPRRRWTAKRMSRQKLVHPWQRPHSAYNLKPRYKPRENLLWIDLYLSTTAEFNNTTFYDHYAGALDVRDRDAVQ